MSSFVRLFAKEKRRAEPWALLFDCEVEGCSVVFMIGCGRWNNLSRMFGGEGDESFLY